MFYKKYKNPNIKKAYEDYFKQFGTEPPILFKRLRLF